MEAFKNKLKRRDFLEWLTVAGFGGASGLHFMAPLPKEKASAGRPSVKEQAVKVRNSEKTGFHVFSKHLQFLDYEGMAEAAAEIGFEGVDLTVRPGGHVLPENVEQDLPKAVEALRRHGLEATMMTTALTDPRDEINRKVLRTASELGIQNYRTNWLWYNEEKGIAENLAHFQEILGALAKLNEELKIKGDYQNHAGFSGYPLGGPVWDLKEVLDGIDNPFMGSQYDIRHATVEGATSWPLGLKRIRSHINSLVVKDFKWDKVDGEWRIINTPIGEGMVDFPKFFALLKEHNISAPISVHYEYKLPEQQGNLSKRQVRQQTIQLMQKDLNKLKEYKKEAGLG